MPDSRREVPSPDFVPAKAQTWATSLSGQGMADVEWSESLRTLRFTTAAGGGSRSLDLTAVPLRDIIVQVSGSAYDPQRPTNPERWFLEVPETTRCLTITLTADTQALISVSGDLSPLTLRVGGLARDRCRLLLHATPIHKLYLQSVSVEVDGAVSLANRTIDLVRNDHSDLVCSGRNINILQTDGKCGLALSQTPVGRLVPAKQSVLSIVTAKCSVTSMRNGSPDQGGPANLDVPDVILSRDSDLTVETIDSAHVVIKRGGHLRCTRPAKNLRLTGPGTVHIAAGAETLEFRAPTPTLEIENHSQVVDATGRVSMGNVSGSSLIGRPSTRRNFQTSQSLYVVGVPSTPDELSGVSITNVAFRCDLDGLRIIAALEEYAFHVAPSVHDELPGLGPLAGPKFSAYRKVSASEAELLIRAQYARALSELAINKGAPGSTRTLLAWCAYRMRAVVAPGWWERLILAAYRTIGYGERVGPALIAVALLVTLFSVWALADGGIVISGQGAQVWLASLLDWAVTPLHILNLTGDNRPEDFQFPQPWDTVARFLVAVPFATAVLALRNYVKNDARRT